MERTKAKSKYSLLLMAAALAAIFMFSVTLGRYPVTVRELWGIFSARLWGGEKTWSQLTENIVMQVRLPRIAAAVAVGAALGVSGTAYQCIFRNPMAAPDVLGASTGAAFGAALAIITGHGGVTLILCAFLFSALCVLSALLCARLSRGSRVIALVLSGIMMSSLFQAGTSFIKLIADPSNTLPAITYWLMGSLSDVKGADLRLLWPPMLLGFVPIFLLRWKINLLTLDDREARSMGVNTAAVRLCVIVASTLLTAAAVSVSGIVGWVGLVIPHMARRIVGSDCRQLVPASALLGGGFLLLVDDLARNLYTVELPLSILTAVIGAPFFIYLLIRKGEW